MSNRMNLVSRPWRLTMGAIALMLAMPASACTGCNNPPEPREAPSAVVPSPEGSAPAGAAGEAPGVTAQSNEERSSGGCVIGGCSGEVCQAADEPPLMTTCIAKPEWKCYRTALCGRDAEGQCNWQNSPELDKCLQKHRGQLVVP